MKIKISLLLLLFFFSTTKGQTQSKHSLLLQTGYTWTNNLSLNELAIENSQGMVLDLGFGYRLFQTSFMFTELALTGKTIFSSGQLHNRNFKATTFRLTLPIKFVFPVPNTNIQLASGAVFQNNVDFHEFDIRMRDKYAWRVNFLLEARYLLKNKTLLTVGFSNNLRNNIPDPYFINDPKIALLIGLQKNLNFSKNKNKRP